MDFSEAMEIAEGGFDSWAAKEHNKKWVRQIDGTPIRNDLIVNIATAFLSADARRVPRCTQCGTLMRKKCDLCAGTMASDQPQPGIGG